jgi:undecaprenyl-diphosphatase
LPLLHILILAVIRGITEFLPVSSSGHLDLAWKAFGLAPWEVAEPSQSDRLIISVAVYVGILGAVCLYFWRDLWHMVAGLIRLLTGQATPGARLALNVFIGTVPFAVVGYFLTRQIAEHLHGNMQIVAWSSIGFGVLLFAADRLGMTVRRVEHLTWVQALIVGLAQVLAFIPGTSRSGITMTAARFMGYERPEAARFSLLLSIPAILGCGTLEGLDLMKAGDVQLHAVAFVAAAIAFVMAIIAIALMLRWLRRAGFTPFVVYRIAFGAAILIWLV